MNKLIELIQSLLNPKKMTKYRHMSILVSIIIFMLSVYILQVPSSNMIKNSRNEIKGQYNYLVLAEIEENLDQDNDQVLKDFSNLGCKVEEGLLVCNEDEFEETIEFTVKGVRKILTLAVDLNLDSTSEESLKLMYDLEDIPYEADTEYYSLVFLKNLLYFQAHQRDINTLEIKHNDNQLGSINRILGYGVSMPELDLGFTGDEYRSIGMILLNIIVDTDIEMGISQSFTLLFFTAFLLPFIFILLFWLVFRKRGKLTTYKEYYNIAAISSILPLVITFALSWVVPMVVQYYMYAFSLYYLFNLFKINNSPDDLDTATNTYQSQKATNHQKQQLEQNNQKPSKEEYFTAEVVEDKEE